MALFTSLRRLLTPEQSQRSRLFIVIKFQVCKQKESTNERQLYLHVNFLNKLCMKRSKVTYIYKVRRNIGYSLLTRNQSKCKTYVNVAYSISSMKEPLLISNLFRFPASQRTLRTQALPSLP